MKIRLAIALLLLLPQIATAQSFRDNTRVVIRGLLPATKYKIEYQQTVPVWKRFTVDRCGTIMLKKRDAEGILGNSNNYEFRADDEDKSITSINVSDSQRANNRAAINWDSKDSTRLGYKCTNGEIGTNLDPYWLNAGSGIRFHYHGARGTQAEKLYITGIDSSNVHIRSLDAGDANGSRMRRTLTTDKCGQLKIKHNEKYPASGLGLFFVTQIIPGEPYVGASYFNYEELPILASPVNCKAPYNVIP